MRTSSLIAVTLLVLVGCKSRGTNDRRLELTTNAPPESLREAPCPSVAARLPASLHPLEDELGDRADTATQSARIDIQRLSPSVREKLIVAKEALDTAGRQWGNARDRVAIACFQFVNALDKLRLEGFASTTTNKNLSAAFEEVVSHTRCWPFTADANETLTSLKGELASMKATAASSATEDQESIKTLDALYDGIVAAREQLRPTFAKYDSTAQILATALNASGALARTTPADRVALLLAIARVPHMRDASAGLEIVIRELSRKEDGDGPGAVSMCGNVEASSDFSGASIDDKPTVENMQHRWEERAGVVQSRLDHLFDVPGTEL